ncbi:hypothetical protein PsYK624_059980 [Phanerochaete sordida]|uniref:Uncharacterized protein n=1 Tax=Phanerochaete sordida TaxID=48140 RepID=A0A9P3G7T3_9APHY|nr:hypothetical protein PsYK624_059980 [Phanerochaete sordida]
MAPETLLIPLLTDLIFDHLVDLGYGLVQPKQSLFACSLVCKLWAEHTHRHRFRTLALYSLSYDIHAHTASFTIQQFVHDPLFSRSKDAVRTLLLCYEEANRAAVDEYDFPQIIRRFPALSSLELRGVLHGRFAQPLPHPTSHLHLQRLTINFRLQPQNTLDEHALYNVLSQFDSIEELRITGIPSSGFRVPVGVPRSTKPPPSVISVVLRCDPSRALSSVLQWLAAPGSLEQLDVLGQVNTGPSAALALVDALPAAPRHLLFAIAL